MGGPPKKRAQAEKKSSSSSDTQQSSGNRNATQRSTPKSIPRLDGNRDPAGGQGRAPIEYSKPTSMKNISEFLGMAGWAVVHGVSTHLFPMFCACYVSPPILSFLIFSASCIMQMSGKQTNRDSPLCCAWILAFRCGDRSSDPHAPSSFAH